MLTELAPRFKLLGTLIAVLAVFVGVSWAQNTVATSAQTAAVAIVQPAHCDQSTTKVSNPTCFGAKGDGVADDTSAIRQAIASALTSKIPLLLPQGRYRVTSTIDLDYAAVARAGFEIISQNASIDGTAIAAAPVMKIHCSVFDCFYFHVSGPLSIFGKTSTFALVIGNPDYTDAQNSMRFDNLIVNNSGVGGGTQLNYVLASNIFISSATAGDVGLSLTQTVFTNISGASSGNKSAITIEKGYSYANTFTSMDSEASPVCVTISATNAVNNTFVTPMWNCATGVIATAGRDNVIINPMWGGSIISRTKGNTGLRFVPEDQVAPAAGSGSRWSFMATGAYTATASDNGLNVSSYNSPAGMTITLPNYSALTNGWTMGFSVDNGKSMTVQVAPGSVSSILVNGKAVKSIRLFDQAYEYLQLQYDGGGNFRIVNITPKTAASL